MMLFILAENIRRGLPTLVLVHAVNPVGFAKSRRVNEENVDLNRYVGSYSTSYYSTLTHSIKQELFDGE
jgi:hypothetical protein